MRVKLFGILQFSLTGFVIVLLSACGSDSSSETKQEENLARPAKLITIGQTKRDDFLNYPAVIKSLKLRKLSFAVGGVVQDVLVVEAQAVKKGDVLAKLDQRDLQAKIKSAQAQYDNANAEYERAVRLMKGNAISRSDLEKRKSGRDVNKAALETTQKALEDSVLIAPYDGKISKVSIKKQQNIQVGAQAIDILGDGGLEAVINLPSSILVKSGDGGEGTAYIVLDAAVGQRIPATFKEISLEADAATQTYELTFTFNAPEGIIVLPGMNATVWFKDPSKPATAVRSVSIPLTAIATDGDKKYVWVVDQATMKVSKRQVVVAADVGSTITIMNGLKLGETIVSAGISVLSEGMKVTPWLK